MTTDLKQRIRDRLARLIAEETPPGVVPAEPNDLVVELMETQIARHLRLIPDEALRNVIHESPELVERWPIDIRPDPEDPDFAQVLSVLVGQKIPSNRKWPGDVKPFDAARVLASYWERETATKLNSPIEKTTIEEIAALLRNDHSELASALRAAFLLTQIDVHQFLGESQKPFDPIHRDNARKLRQRFPPVFWGTRSESEIHFSEHILSATAGSELTPRDELLDWFALTQLFGVFFNWHPVAVAALCSIVREVCSRHARNVLNTYAAESLNDEYAGHLEQLIKETLKETKRGSDDVQTIAQLRDGVRAHLVKLTDVLNERKSGREWIETFALHLEQLDDQGRKFALELREQIASTNNELAIEHLHWQLWTPVTSPPGAGFIRGLAIALWLDRVLPGLKKPAALTMLVHQPVADLFAALPRLHREEERSGQRVLALPGDVLVRVLTTGDDNSIDSTSVDRGLKLFGSVTAHKLLRWQVCTAHQQALEHNPDPRMLRVPGGYAALARDLLGLKGDKAINMVRRIIEAEHSVNIPLSPRGEYTRLLIRTYRAAVGRRPANLELVLGTVLLPDYVHELQEAYGNKSLDARRATRLVPILPVPPLIGRDNEHGAQATLSMLLVAYLREHARELVEHGGVIVNRSTLVELAKRASLPHSANLDQILERWTCDGDDGEAMLKRVGSARYTLADSHAAARSFIEEGGRRELDASNAGKVSVTKRAAARRRTRKVGA